jgi:hypothetical protein
MADSLIGRRRKAKELLRSTSSMYATGRTAGMTGISEDVADAGAAIKALNAEANRIGKSDAKLADDLRKRALKIANMRKRR